MFLVFSFIILGIFSDMFLQKITFEYEAEPQLFLACSKFLGKFEPRCSYKIVLIKKACI